MNGGNSRVSISVKSVLVGMPGPLVYMTDRYGKSSMDGSAANPCGSTSPAQNIIRLIDVLMLSEGRVLRWSCVKDNNDSIKQLQATDIHHYLQVWPSCMYVSVTSHLKTS